MCSLEVLYSLFVALQSFLSLIQHQTCDKPYFYYCARSIVTTFSFISYFSLTHVAFTPSFSYLFFSRFNIFAFSHIWLIRDRNFSGGLIIFIYYCFHFEGFLLGARILLITCHDRIGRNHKTS